MSTVMSCKDGAPARASSWLGVLAIALGAFALVVMEFLPVGLLPGIVKGFGVSDGLAGLTVTATAAAGFVAAPAVALAVGRLDRRLVLLGLSALVIVSGLISLAAPNLAMLVAARVILGIGVGGFWSISIVAAARLVPERDAPKASSLVFAGISVASVVGIPMGAWLSARYDWRVAFGAAMLLAVSVFLLQLFALPKIEMRQSATAADFLGLLKSRRIVAIYLTIVLIVAGHFAGYTFITPYLQRFARFDADTLSALLLLFGAVAVAGNFVGGALAGRSLPRTIRSTIALFLVALAAMALFPLHAPVIVASLLAWALAWGMAPVGTQLWLASATRHAPEAAQSINTSVFQLSIALGSLAGGIAVDHVDLRASMWVGTGLFVLAVVMAAVAGRLNAPRAVDV